MRMRIAGFLFLKEEFQHPRIFSFSLPVPFYSCNCFPVRLFLLLSLYLDLLQTVQVYIMFVFFVVLDFLLNFETAGLEPHFPLFPMPLPRPLFLALEILPLVRVPLFAPVETSFIFCSVCFLQYGQNLFVFFGNFILIFLLLPLKSFLYVWSRSYL